MQQRFMVGAVVTAVCVVGTWWLARGNPEAPPAGTRAGEVASATPATGVASGEASRADGAMHAATGAGPADLAPAVEGAPGREAAASGAAMRDDVSSAGASAVQSFSAASVDAAPTGPDPMVAEALARVALRDVGKDAGAEAIWRRAIDDPGLSTEARSDLIEDLNDEGYTDPHKLSKADLPLILARMRLIERLAPYAMDEVNAAAFEEAYKDLIEMLATLRAQ